LGVSNNQLFSRTIMGLLADWQIIERCEQQQMIEPFHRRSVKTLETEKGTQRILSKGVSSYGYDIVLNKDDLKIFTNMTGKIVNPRKMDKCNYQTPELLTDEDGLQYVVLPPNSVMLGHTVEYFKIPRDILGECLAKSTYARAGISLLVTPLEPEWEGVLVVEIVNHTTSHVMIFVDQGIGQLLFHKGDATCTTSYKDRGGKYQGQTGTQDALV
jgi:dCTP deaminase